MAILLPSEHFKITRAEKLRPHSSVTWMHRQASHLLILRSTVRPATSPQRTQHLEVSESNDTDPWIYSAFVILLLLQHTDPETTLNLFIGIILYDSDLVVLTHAYMMSWNYTITQCHRARMVHKSYCELRKRLRLQEIVGLTYVMKPHPQK